MPLHAEDAAGGFLRAYTEFQNGERLEQAGDYDKALTKYRFAASLLEQISRSDPDWQPMVVQYRLRKITESIGRVEALAGSAPSSTGGGAGIDFPEGDLPSFDERPSGRRPSPPPVTFEQPSTPPRGRSLENPAAAQELSRLRDENRQLRDQLTQRTAELKSAKHEVDKTLVTVVELRHELMQAKTRLQDALQNSGSVKKLREDFAKQLKQISEEMEKTRAERDVLAEENEQLLAKLDRAAKYIAASDEIRKNLETERNTFFAESSELRADRDKVQGELEKTLGELKSSRERIGELEVLASENQTLKETLARTNEQIAGLEERLKEAGGAEIAQLKDAHAKEIAEREEQIRALKEEAKQAEEKLAKGTGNETQATAELAAAREKIAELETQNAESAILKEKLAETEKQLAALRESTPEIAELQRQLEEARARLAEAQAANPQMKEIQDKLTEAQNQLAEALAAQKNTSALEDKLAALQKELDAATAANAETKALREQLAAAEAKAAEAEKKAAEAAATKPVNDEAILALQVELNSVNDRLFALRGELAARDTRIADLEKQLDDTAGELAKLRLDPAPSPELAKAQNEIELLRNILLRQLKEQARRDQARRMVEEEIAKLENRSESLKENLGILGAPIDITEEERSLFRLPVAVIENSDSAESMEASITITKTDESPGAGGNATASPSPSPDKPAQPLAFKDLPKNLQETANKGQKQFDDGNLDAAEKSFLEIAQAEPQNSYAFAQLAATQFQLGKFKAAEVALNRALELNPEDAFANSILGVVYFRQNRLEDAEKTLRKAISLDPKKARSYNYLGIVVSQKGKFGEAEEMLQKAIEIDPKYAEAHFNLAVIYATQEPPSKELAKQHYQNALSLGAEPDPSLQRLIY